MRPKVTVARIVLTLLLAVVGTATGCAQPKLKPAQEATPKQIEAVPSQTVAPLSIGESNPQTEKVTVPDLVSRGMTSARMVLGSNHLTFEVVTDPPGADLPMDNSVTIIKQDPAPGEVVDSGSTVTVTVKAK